ncbi:MAG: response regulator [Actinomycetota bacterium]|nr:response regulator [Actinomycetota bacterium]
MADERPVVLVAEDDPSVRLALEFVLKYEGFDVVFAEDGIKALEMARNARPDIILLDHLMPKMDGREVLGELKGDENTSGIPVLVLTGMPERDSENWEGAEFVGKPFTPDELIAKINAALGESDRSG